MSERAATAVLILFCLALVGVAGYAVWNAVDEKDRNRQHCVNQGAKPVHTGHSNYLCVAADGRVVP